jgi:hypothetical protein
MANHAGKHGRSLISVLSPRSKRGTNTAECPDKALEPFHSCPLIRAVDNAPGHPAASPHFLLVQTPGTSVDTREDHVSAPELAGALCLSISGPGHDVKHTFLQRCADCLSFENCSLPWIGNAKIFAV